MTADVLLDAIPLPAWIHDIETHEILAVNDAFVTLTGRSQEQLVGMSLFDLTAPEDRPRAALIREQLMALSEGPLQHPAPFRLLVKGGGTVRARISSKPLPSVRRHARLAIAHDIQSDEVQQSQDKLAQSELRYRTLFDACPIAACVYDLATFEFIAINDAMVRQYGYSREELFTMNLLDLVSPADVPVLRAVIERSRKGPPPGVITPLRPIRHLTKGGEELYIIGTATSLLDDGRPARLVLHHDVTQQKRAEEALRISDSLSRSILDNMLSALITVGEDGLIQTVNPAAGEVFGYASDEVAGAPFSALFDTSMRDSKKLLSSAHGRVTEWMGRRKSGARFPCEVRVFRLEGPRGTGYGATLHDVSERYEVERMKSEFVSVVSHELRTPLTSVRGSIGLLAGGVLGPLPENVMELLGIADRNTRRLISLVNDILDLERLEKGHMGLPLRPVELRTIIERSLESVAHLAEQESIRIDVHPTDDLVRGDADRLSQVLVNLLSNAVKFSPPGGVVVVTAAAEAETVIVRVIDHGRGIPAHSRRVIFERFHQIHASDSREKGGTGLGLAISKAIIEQHHGSIGVESEEGKGSTFWFRVPRAS